MNSSEASAASPVRIVVFEDAEAGRVEYRRILKDHDVRFRDTAELSEAIGQKLIEFGPQLLVVDLVMGQDREDGLDLIKRLRRIRGLDAVPIVVCSKLINDTAQGKEVRRVVLELRGVVAALPKVPHYPAADQLVSFAASGN